MERVRKRMWWENVVGECGRIMWWDNVVHLRQRLRWINEIKL